ncbi:MAG TPA: hypothetical protein VK789_27735, partial [Bryobacteraceae bacterium]|nr:hypothetical protein [Bryobacteraceae bacterium]
RWTLAVGVLFVVLGGLFPNLIVAQRSAEADRVVSAQAGPSVWAELSEHPPERIDHRPAASGESTRH